ncbi:hypothetical protein CAEBREN_09075 [Caenorhabditis brenneri]|uniref:Uncharacterized protein n=1 Tax=Caenorhabditis brenneri TaxID=135651 RepID=G0PD34_CAEBE|nr:hypothetical protein CAEBREN_09075 [Caenorhabditis brenneri]
MRKRGDRSKWYSRAYLLTVKSDTKMEVLIEPEKQTTAKHEETRTIQEEVLLSGTTDQPQINCSTIDDRNFQRSYSIFFDIFKKSVSPEFGKRAFYRQKKEKMSLRFKHNKGSDFRSLFSDKRTSFIG